MRRRKKDEGRLDAVERKSRGVSGERKEAIEEAVQEQVGGLGEKGGKEKKEKDENVRGGCGRS